jgi:hypothetical protein
MKVSGRQADAVCIIMFIKQLKHLARQFPVYPAGEMLYIEYIHGSPTSGGRASSNDHDPHT